MHRLADRWTWPQILKRAAEVRREEGLKSLWFKILGETVYRRACCLSVFFTNPSWRSRLACG